MRGKMRPETLRGLMVEEARTWLGTPFRHQARIKAVGVDCVGLCIGVNIALNALPDWSEEAWRPYAGYGRTPNPDKMTEALNLFMRPVCDTPRSGDWAFIEWRTGQGRSLPMHMAMLAEGPNGQTIIHAYEVNKAVVEHGFVSGWPEQVVSWWRAPRLAELVESYGGNR